MRDAFYIFDRFEELSAGVTAQMDNYPVEIRRRSKKVLSKIVKIVELEKPRLNTMLGQSKPSSVDLFDIYNLLDQIAFEIGYESSNVAEFGDQKTSLDMAQLSARAMGVATNLGVILRAQISTQESQLPSCAHKTKAVPKS